MVNVNNYQGGGDVRLGGLVGGVYKAYKDSQAKKEAEAKEKALREEKQQEVFNQQLAKTMASVSTKGLQQKDIPGFQKLYSQMEDEYIKASSTTDKAQRLLGMAKVKQLATEATLYTQQSEMLGKKKAEQLKLLQNGYDKFEAEDAMKAINAHYDRPLSEVTTDFDIMAYRHKWDSGKLDSTLDSIKKDILTSSAEITPTEQIIGGYQNGYDRVNTIRSTKVIPEAVAVGAFKNKYNTDINFKRYVDTEFDGSLDSKLSQLYTNLSAANWNTEVKDSSRVQGRAPVRSSGGSSSGSSNDSEPDVLNTSGIDIAFAGNNVASATKHIALKGNGMKARISKDVRAYDMATGDPIEITSGMEDGVIQEFVQLPTGSVKGKGRRILAKGTEDKFSKTKQFEDFAVVRYKKPIYVSVDDKNIVVPLKGAELQKAIRDKQVVKGGSEDLVGLFPMDKVVPSRESMTKGEKATVSKFKGEQVKTPKRTSKVLSGL